MFDPIAQLLVGIAAASAIAYIAFRYKLLGRSGAWATFLLGSVVFGLGGLQWSLPLITFFLLSSLLSKYSPKRREAVRDQLNLIFEKGSTRDAGQVLSNGGVAGLIVILYTIDPRPEFYIAYVGALAAAAADTWATEIGVLARGSTLSILTLRPVNRGTSGGISLAGIMGAVAGAISVAISAAPWYPRLLPLVPVVVLSGVIGSIADSIAGGAIQGTYRCPVCGLVTERQIHCGHRATLEHGYRWIGNDLVNLLCCVVGAITAYLFVL